MGIHLQESLQPCLKFRKVSFTSMCVPIMRFVPKRKKKLKEISGPVAFTRFYIRLVRQQGLFHFDRLLMALLQAENKSEFKLSRT